MKRASGHGDRQAQALDAVTGLIRGQVVPPTTAELQHGLQGLFARLASRDARRHGGWWRWPVAGLGTAALLGALALWVVRPRVQPAGTSPLPALTYQVHGGTLIAGGYLRESGGDGIKLSFSEGTEFVLMPGTHGRLRSVGGAGARIAIEQGTAYFQVTPNSGRTWLVDVGPFLVTVKGTVFTVSWDPLRERFELRLRRGRVVVSGPVSGGDIVLREGQRLTVDLPGAQTLISEDDEGAPGKNGAPRAAGSPARADFDAPAPAASGSADTVVTGRGRSGAAPVGRAARLERSLRWSEAVASGDWDAILADADRAGVREILDGASSEALFALADAARYRGRLDLARDALLAQRRRFSSSGRASDAAFLLGRVAEMSGEEPARALRWYDEYLARAPAGTYASEALGRRMTLIKQREGAVRARPIAEEYLRRFPEGTYAGSARALLH
jgi:hypothetical protein